MQGDYIAYAHYVGDINTPDIRDKAAKKSDEEFTQYCKSRMSMLLHVSAGSDVTEQAREDRNVNEAETRWDPDHLHRVAFVESHTEHVSPFNLYVKPI